MRPAWTVLPGPRLYCCPLCGREIFETVYVDRGGSIRGCDRCLRLRPVEDWLSGEEVRGWI